MAKKKKAGGGAPEWVVTYGDMMSLLLCFFIMLAALSELKKEDDFKMIAEMVKQGLGARSAGGMVPTDMDPAMSLKQRLEKIQLQTKRGKDPSHADDPGTEGRYEAVIIVRPGIRFIRGSRITFEPGSADLNDEGRRRLDQVAQQLRGQNNKIIVAGHAASAEVDLGSDKSDLWLWRLSYARAQAVMAYLTSEETGIRPERFRLEANAAREPLKNRVYTPLGRTPNRRVEVFESELLVDDFTRPEMDR